MENAGTVHQKIVELSEQYVNLYKSFKSHNQKRLGSSPEALALHDLIINKYIYESAYENVKEYIAADQAKGQ